jgi:hypothetical protein
MGTADFAISAKHHKLTGILHLIVGFSSTINGKVGI